MVQPTSGGNVNPANLNFQGLNTAQNVVGTDILILSRVGKPNTKVAAAVVAALGGGGIGGSITDNQIAIGAATADDIEGSSALEFDGVLLKHTAADPIHALVDSNGAANNTRWQMVVDSAGLNWRLQATLDDGSFAGDGIIATRSFGTISSIEIPTNFIIPTAGSFQIVDDRNMAFGTGFDVIVHYDSLSNSLQFDAATASVRFGSGMQVRIAGVGGEEFTGFSHDETDLNQVFVNTVDWNITGLSGSIQAGGIDADFDALTATSFNGVPLTDGGAATNFLNETGAYSVPGGGAIANNAVQARRTTSFTIIASFVDVTLDATDIETDSAVIEHDAITDRIVVKVAGTYKIAVELDITNTLSAPNDLVLVQSRVRLNDAGTGIDGSIANQTAFQDTSVGGGDGNFNPHLSNEFIVTLAANDFITLQLNQIPDGTLTVFLAENTSLQVTRLL